MPSCTWAWRSCKRARTRARRCRRCAACKAPTARRTSAACGPSTPTSRPESSSLALALPDYVDALGDGCYAIDTGFERPLFDAAYLIIERGRAAFIDTGTSLAVPRLLPALRALDRGRARGDWGRPTHRR